MKLKNLFYISVMVFVLFLTGCSNSSAADKKESQVSNEKYEEIVSAMIDGYDGDFKKVHEVAVYDISDYEINEPGYDYSLDNLVMIRIIADLENDRYKFENEDWYEVYDLENDEFWGDATLSNSDRAEKMIKDSELLYEKEY